MKTIHKYKLGDYAHANIVEMPEYAEVLTAQMKDGDIHIWALFETMYGDFPYPEDKVVKRRFHIYGTGWEISDTAYNLNTLKYIATVQTEGYVWHVFEEV
jgi:hypothetical protein